QPVAAQLALKPDQIVARTGTRQFDALEALLVVAASLVGTTLRFHPRELLGRLPVDFEASETCAFRRLAFGAFTISPLTVGAFTVGPLALGTLTVGALPLEIGKAVAQLFLLALGLFTARLLIAIGAVKRGELVLRQAGIGRAGILADELAQRIGTGLIFDPLPRHLVVLIEVILAQQRA